MLIQMTKHTKTRTYVMQIKCRITCSMGLLRTRALFPFDPCYTVSTSAHNYDIHEDEFKLIDKNNRNRIETVPKHLIMFRYS